MISKRLVILIILIMCSISIKASQDTNSLFGGISIGEHWESVENKVKMLVNKSDSEKSFFTYDAYAYASFINIALNVRLKDDTKALIVFDESFNKALKKKSKVLLIDITDSSFLWKGKKVIGKKISNILSLLKHPKVSYKNQFFNGIIDDNGIIIMTAPWRISEQKIFKSDTVRMIGLVKLDHAFRRMPLENCYIDENYEDWKKKQEK